MFHLRAILALKSRLIDKIPHMTIIGAATQKAIRAASANQLSSSSPITEAIRSQNRIFVGYVIASLLVLLGTIFLFRSSGRVQDAIKADADARIKGADERIKQVESNAKERIAQVESNAQVRIAGIESSRLKAKRESDEKIASLANEAENAKKDAAEALENAEAERLERVKLQKSMQPRFLHQSEIGTRLRVFPGTRFIIRALAESEAVDFARLIEGMLVLISGWKEVFPIEFISPADAANLSIRPGVWVERGLPDFANRDGMLERNRSLGAASAALIAEFNGAGVFCTTFAAGPEVPVETLRIVIGRNPALNEPFGPR
jgi:hypothetical protein